MRDTPDNSILRDREQPFTAHDVNLRLNFGSQNPP